jgi:hypothetical protein
MQPDGWDGDNLTRSDGLAITSLASGWRIWPVGASEPISKCPCCGLSVWTARSARLLANQLFPLSQEPA